LAISTILAIPAIMASGSGLRNRTTPSVSGYRRLSIDAGGRAKRNAQTLCQFSKSLRRPTQLLVLDTQPEDFLFEHA
jgi:hypothetical protein